MFYDTQGNRFYPDGSRPPPQLPSSYGWSGLIIHPGERCDNCKFYNNGFCSRWNAQVRSDYWCDAWEGKQQ